MLPWTAWPVSSRSRVFWKRRRKRCEQTQTEGGTSLLSRLQVYGPCATSTWFMWLLAGPPPLGLILCVKVNVHFLASHFKINLPLRLAISRPPRNNLEMLWGGSDLYWEFLNSAPPNQGFSLLLPHNPRQVCKWQDAKERWMGKAPPPTHPSLPLLILMVPTAGGGQGFNGCYFAKMPVSSFLP